MVESILNRKHVLVLQNVSKFYKLYDSPKDRLKEALSPFRKKYHKEFYALQNISFELKQGECLGIIGKNGSGKSTLLKLIAHIIEPSSGTVTVNGSVSALLELGTGFNPEFTGLQNIYFYGTILGFDKNEIKKRLDEIIAFADIGDFINQPVKTYSSGMFVRLAFAVQTSLSADILLVDEVLSVGDIFFQQKCHTRIEELLAKGTALILVSHDMQLIQKYATKTILLNMGAQYYYGNAMETILKYFSLDGKFEKERNINLKIHADVKQIEDNLTYSSNLKMKWPESIEYSDLSNIMYNCNDSAVKLISFAICNDKAMNMNSYYIGEMIYFYYELQFLEEVDVPICAISFTNIKNLIVHAKDTLQYDNSREVKSLKYQKSKRIRFMQSFKLDFPQGQYTYSLGIGEVNENDLGKIKKVDFNQRESLIKKIASITNIGFFEITEGKDNNRFPFHGLVNVPGELKVYFTGEHDEE